MPFGLVPRERNVVQVQAQSALPVPAGLGSRDRARPSGARRGAGLEQRGPPRMRQHCPAKAMGSIPLPGSVREDAVRGGAHDQGRVGGCQVVVGGGMVMLAGCLKVAVAVEEELISGSLSWRLCSTPVTVPVTCKLPRRTAAGVSAVRSSRARPRMWTALVRGRSSRLLGGRHALGHCVCLVFGQRFGRPLRAVVDARRESADDDPIAFTALLDLVVSGPAGEYAAARDDPHPARPVRDAVDLLLCSHGQFSSGQWVGYGVPRADSLRTRWCTPWCMAQGRGARRCRPGRPHHGGRRGGTGGQARPRRAGRCG